MATSSSSPFPPLTRRLPEDTVFYSIYPDSTTSSSTSLHSLHLQILRLLSPHLRHYIWQHEPFHLTPSPNPPTPHLHGKTRFGDNLDDEWFLLSLLFLVSLHFPSLSIRASDSDGEFLLIEAAFALPRWLRPDSSPNRVFIRQGHLHIIPRSHFPSTPSLESALDCLKSGKIDTRASDSVQSLIQKKISGYPEKAMTNMHRVRVRVPLPVARVLKQEPCLISLAVEGFYDRDVDSMKYAAKMEKFLRSGREKGEVEMVSTSVRMSRAMYGQLVQQNFQAPRCYPMPLRREVGVEGYKEAELGMKIACGFEMLYWERKRRGEEGRGGAWDAFLKSLEESGCFEGLLPGSKEYRRIVEEANEYYRSTELFSRERELMNAPVRRIDEILASAYSINEFNGSELPPSDDDSWLYNGEDELNSAILERQKELESYEFECSQKQKSKEQKAAGNTFSKQSEDFDFKDVAESMQAFVQKLSSFEGVEVPENRNSTAVDFDVARFIKDMESVVGPMCDEQTIHDADFQEGSTSSSEMDFDESEGESDIAEPCGGEDMEDDFMQTYSDSLNEEISGSTLKESFIRACQLPNRDDGVTSNTSKDVVDELTPVDVDINLVKNILDSCSSQEGLPGPASNLLGLMGLKVPHGATNK